MIFKGNHLDFLEITWILAQHLVKYCRKIQLEYVFQRHKFDVKDGKNPENRLRRYDLYRYHTIYITL